MSFADFENLLWQTMGLDPASIGSIHIERAVLARQTACGLQDRASYLEHVHRSASELQQLVEAIVVPETWFFRDEDAFAALSSIVLRQWQAARPGQVLRLLSLPCSTGEEPFSLAMALLDLGIPGDRFRIDAVDISERALALAEAGVYGRNAFRGKELGFRERYFTQAQGYRIVDAARVPVRFRQGNLLSPASLPAGTSYDIILCRNVLIYLERSMQRRGIEVLKGRLDQHGFLFVSPSETGLLPGEGLVSEKFGRARAFRKAGAGDADTRAPIPQAKQPTAIRAPAVHRPAPAPKAPSRPVPPAAPNSPEAAGIDEAERLADQGQLTDAAALCARNLQTQGPSARAFCLLGLVHDAGGDAAQAAHQYRKALYLDPHHREALLHLAYLLDKQGDAAGGRLMRERAGRTQGRKPETP
jgi:chemotaxis protein methyltransferase WspC